MLGAGVQVGLVLGAHFGSELHLLKGSLSSHDLSYRVKWTYLFRKRYHSKEWKSLYA